MSHPIQIKTAHLYELCSELAVESGDLSLYAQFTTSNREGYYLIVSRTVAHTLEDV